MDPPAGALYDPAGGMGRHGTSSIVHKSNYFSRRPNSRRVCQWHFAQSVENITPE